MDNADDLLKYDSLAFFGKVNASISHELKNIMAIISETAGLLGDLADLASTGNPVEPDVLKNCAGSIMEEIQRGFSTIRQMNRFSHSIDYPHPNGRPARSARPGDQPVRFSQLCRKGADSRQRSRQTGGV